MILTNRINRYPTPFWADLDQFFQRAFARVPDGSGGRPFVVAESEAGWTLRADLPGFAKEDVDVSVEEGLLKVTARETEENPGFVPGFEQRMQLPEQVDRTRISARLQNGVLEISLPRHEKEEPREIRIAVD